MKRILKQFGLSVLIAAVFVQFASARSLADFSSVELLANDTVAGLGTSLTAKGLAPYDEVIFDLRLPVGKTLSFSAFADEDGFASFNLEKEASSYAGEYFFAVRNDDGASSSVSSFEVLADELSVDDSVFLVSERNIQADGSTSKIEIYLKDAYKNAIPFHEVKLLAKRASDDVKLFSDDSYTDDAGQITYLVGSDEPGRAEFYVYDVTANELLREPVVINFESADSIADRFENVGGNDDFSIFEPYDEFDTEDSFAILSFIENEFIFPNFPDGVTAGEPTSFTLEIEDSDGLVAQDYVGTVRFSVPGAQVGEVNLPEDYTFTIEDQGSHTFPLSLQFQKEGTYKLIAQDLDDDEMLTEQVVVVGSGASSSAFADVGDGIAITQPASGSSYSNPSQVIEGKAAPGLAIKIYDNDKELASVSTDIKGDFTYTTSPLLEGDHTIYAVSISTDGAIVDVSDDVNFKIDVSAPTISSIKLDPSTGANPGQSVNLELEASEALNQVLVKFGAGNVILNPVDGTTNKFKGVLQAPQDLGSHPFAVTLVDALGNQTVVEKAAQLIVGSGVDGESFVAKVQQVEAHPSNNRVTLIWQKPTSTLPIKHYRVYYGESPDLLNHIVDTLNANTTWYVPNLVNDRAYYFAVTAVDEKGSQSSELSAAVQSTPFASVVVDTPIFDPFPDDTFPGAEIVTESPSMQGDTGPEMILLLPFSVLLGNSFRRRKKN